MDSIEMIREQHNKRSRGDVLIKLVQIAEDVGYLKRPNKELQASILGVKPDQAPYTSAESWSLAGIIAKKYRPWLDRGIIPIRYPDVMGVLESHDDTIAWTVYQEIPIIFKALLEKEPETDYRLPTDDSLHGQEVIIMNGTVKNIHHNIHQKRDGAFKYIRVDGPLCIPWIRIPHNKAHWVKKGMDVEVIGRLYTRNGRLRIEAVQIDTQWHDKYQPIRDLADEWILTRAEIRKVLDMLNDYKDGYRFRAFTNYARMGKSSISFEVKDNKKILLKDHNMCTQPPGPAGLEQCIQLWRSIPNISEILDEKTRYEKGILN